MFDPTNKEYQVSEKYRPDKASTWHHPISKDGWMHAHNSLRGEITMLQEAFRAMHKRSKDNINQWEINELKKATYQHFLHIHAHHSNEDDLLVPELSERVHFPEKFSADHVELVAKITKIENIISKLKEGDNINDIGIVSEWSEYKDLVFEHLQEEEEIGIPLMRAYFTPGEIAPIVQKILPRGPKVELGSVVHSMGVTTFRNELMKQEGIPSFVWYIHFKSKYSYFLKEFMKPVDALKTGQKPKTGWFYFL